MEFVNGIGTGFFIGKENFWSGGKAKWAGHEEMDLQWVMGLCNEVMPGLFGVVTAGLFALLTAPLLLYQTLLRTHMG